MNQYKECNVVINATDRERIERLKVSDNTITIKTIKTTYTKEEMEAIARKAFSAGVDKGIALEIYKNEIIESISGSKEEQIADEKFDAVPAENKWIKENL